MHLYALLYGTFGVGVKNSFRLPSGRLHLGEHLPYPTSSRLYGFVPRNSFTNGTDKASDDTRPSCKQTFGGKLGNAVNSIHDLPHSGPDEKRRGSGKVKEG